LLKDGVAATNIILSEGYPTSWNKINVEKPGILTGNYIDRQKLQLLLELSSENYSRTKNLLGTKYDFYFFFETSQTVFFNSSFEGAGKQGVNSSAIETMQSKKLIRISRFVILDKKPARMNFYLWQ